MRAAAANDRRADTPRATDGRAPDVFSRGGWVPMRNYREDEAVDFAIVGTGAGGGDARLPSSPKRASPSSPSMPGRFGGRSTISPPTRTSSSKLYWTDERISGGDDPLELGANNSGRAVGGSTVHFPMVSLRLRPEWFESRSPLGYGARLADRLARDVALLRRGRGGAEGLRAGALSVGPAARRAIPIASTR